MATKTIAICDSCNEEITGCRQVTYLAVKLWKDRYAEPDKQLGGEFCSEVCVINAVRKLLQGEKG